MNIGVLIAILIIAAAFICAIRVIVDVVKEKREDKKLREKYIYSEAEVIKLVSKAFHDVLKKDYRIDKFYSEMNLREKANWTHDWFEENVTKKHWLNNDNK